MFLHVDRVRHKKAEGVYGQGAWRGAVAGLTAVTAHLPGGIRRSVAGALAARTALGVSLALRCYY